MTIKPVTDEVSKKMTIMSFVCMVLVVCIHVRTYDEGVGSLFWCIKYFFHSALGAAAVPWFFLASGYFLAGYIDKKNWWSESVIKRVRTLVVPFLIINAITFIVVNVEQMASAKLFNTCGPAPITTRVLLSIVGVDFTSQPYASTLWFIRSLYLYVIASLPIVLLFKCGRVQSLIFLAAVLSVSILGLGKGVISNVFHSTGLLFFSAGIYLRGYPISIKIGTGFCVLIGVGLLIVGCSLYFIGLPFVNELRIALVMVGLWLCAPSTDLPKVIKRNIFPVYLMHNLIFHFVFDIARHSDYVYRSLNNSVGFVFLVIFAISLSIATAEFLRRYFPRLSFYMFGGR